MRNARRRDAGTAHRQPGRPATDVGPVIDEAARGVLVAHARWLDSFAKPIFTCPLDERGHPPRHLLRPTRLRNRQHRAPRTRSLRADPARRPLARRGSRPGLRGHRHTGYGLTLGIHSRIDETIKRITDRLHVGNTYVNRNLIGAVVGVQPFGGEGLSGTGPKAGGPHYLYRFASERTVSVDTTAAGGNAGLMALDYYGSRTVTSN
jgi:RHH-type proline utilization regulon transcriptional repressor/proline dehydrogenase/delta 1-pyrroline-5-carboxylate dehydrogenase